MAPWNDTRSVDGHFGPFQWLGNTHGHGKWQAAYDFLFTFDVVTMTLFAQSSRY